MSDPRDLPTPATEQADRGPSQPPGPGGGGRLVLGGLLGALALGGFGLLGYLLTQTPGGNGHESSAAPDRAPIDGSPATEGSGRNRRGDGAPGTTVSLRLADFEFTVSGVVPDEKTVAEIEAATVATYGERGSTSLEIDSEVEVQPWLDQVPFLVENFGRILDGSIVVDGDGVILSGRASTQDSIDFLVDALSPNNGFPPLSDLAIGVVDLSPPEIVASARSGVLTLSGSVPSPTLEEAIISGAREIYGEAHVVDSLDVDETTYAPFALIDFASDIAAFRPAGDFDIGVRDGAWYGVLGGGITFNASEAELEPEAKRFLDGFPAVLNRSSVAIEVVGHTDDVGPEEANQRLSEARAEAVAVYLIGRGVDPARLVVSGMGETSPVASNATDEGRARNRRVVISMGLDDRSSSPAT